MRVTSAALLICCPVAACAGGIDAVMPHYKAPCQHGCKTWSGADPGLNFWLSAEARDAAGADCAWPGKPWHASFPQPWCWCNPSPSANASDAASAGSAGGGDACSDPAAGGGCNCVAPHGVPEQVNLQLAASDVVVVNFVTFEGARPAAPPAAMLGESATSMKPLTGVTHWYVTSVTPHRSYAMHFVRFAGLRPRQRYSYKVKSGAPGAVWSGVFTFRAPYGSSALSAPAAAAPSQLSAGEQILAGSGLASPSGAAQLDLQGSDGNLVLYSSPAGQPLFAVWSASTAGHPGDRLMLQQDGNLVVYGAGGSALWSSGTAGSGAVTAALRDDCGLHLLNAAGGAVWSTGTVCPGTAPTPPPPAPPVPPSSACGVLDTGYDYYGNDVGSKAVADAEECCKLCAATPGCSFWSLCTDSSPYYCHTKSSRAGRRANKDRVSGAAPGGPPAPPPPPPPPTPPAPPAGAATRIAIYGDMGRDAGSNMANLGADCASGAVDAIVHMGDHCYNMGDYNDNLGDSYVNVFSKAALASCPWIPVLGNHEAVYNEDRVLNQTWGLAYTTSTATSALGHLLTKGSFLAAGMHGANPSGTSRWTSVDLGLLHIVSLDLNTEGPYGSQFEPGGAQATWLEADLAAADANRARVPWILVNSHFPVHFNQLAGNENTSAAYYLGNAAEEAGEGRGFAPCEGAGCKTVGDLLHVQQAALDPILAKHAVDVYMAGHLHNYNSNWPLCGGALCGGRKSYTDPKGTVHITEGNGGVPPVSPDNTVFDCSADWARKCGSGGAYGRLIAYNATMLTYEHVENPTGKVTDTFSIVRSKPGRSW